MLTSNARCAADREFVDIVGTHGSQDVVQEPTGLVQEIMELKEPIQAFLWR